MKKFLTVLCILSFFFGLTGCQTQNANSEASINHQEGAESLAESITNYMVIFFDDATASTFKEYYNEEAIEHLFSTSEDYGIFVDGKGMLVGIDSFNKAYEEFGDLVSVDKITSTVKGNRIHVYVEVTGTLDQAVIHYIFSNDYFVRMKACYFNMGNLSYEMKIYGIYGAISLIILIAFILAVFVVLKGKKSETGNLNHSSYKKADSSSEAIDTTIAHIMEKEELVDDLELVAVITAAIMAYNQETQVTELELSEKTGFVVRTIKKSRRLK
jgi:hypothetical protein